MKLPGAAASGIYTEAHLLSSVATTNAYIAFVCYFIIRCVTNIYDVLPS